jgi:hypothetical protein
VTLNAGLIIRPVGKGELPLRQTYIRGTGRASLRIGSAYRVPPWLAATENFIEIDSQTRR